MASGISLCSIFSCFIPASTRGRKILSLRDMVSSRLKSWNTNPICSLRKTQSSFALISPKFLPFKITCPLVGLSREARMLSKVVFPEPDSPIIATYSPSSTEKLTSFNACTFTCPNLAVYIFFTFFTSSKVISQPPPKITHVLIVYFLYLKLL